MHKVLGGGSDPLERGSRRKNGQLEDQPRHHVGERGR